MSTVSRVYCAAGWRCTAGRKCLARGPHGLSEKEAKMRAFAEGWFPLFYQGRDVWICPQHIVSQPALCKWVGEYLDVLSQLKLLDVKKDEELQSRLFDETEQAVACSMERGDGGKAAAG
jgi:hypothetical protein